MKPRGGEGSKDSWKHWKKTTSRTTLMLHMHTWQPRLSCQPLLMDQKVSSTSAFNNNSAIWLELTIGLVLIGREAKKNSF